MSVSRGLYSYLTDPARLTGHPSVPFERSRRVGGITIYDRNDAREAIRGTVGTRIFLNRVPRDAGMHTTVRIRTLRETPEDLIDGESDTSVESLMLTVSATGGNSAKRASDVASLLRLAMSGYYNDYWGDVYVVECALDGVFSDASPPVKSSDNWSHEVSLEFSVHHKPEETPLYPRDRLLAVASVRVLETEARMSMLSSRVPRGRTITNAQWVVKQGDNLGAVVAIIDGPVHGDAVAGGVTGTNGEPVLALSSVAEVWQWVTAGDLEWSTNGDVDGIGGGFAGTYFYVLTITDSSGSTSSTEGYFHG